MKKTKREGEGVMLSSGFEWENGDRRSTGGKSRSDGTG